MESNYLERRINGIKDLNTLIKNNTLYKTSTTFTTEFLLEWMKENGVFSVIWDPRKTHLQLVQRSSDIFRLLAKEKQLSGDLLDLIWGLAESDYKTDVLKFVGESSFYLDEEQAMFFVQAVAKSPCEKLTNADFDVVCELGKYSKSKALADYVFDFFFDCICNEAVKEELSDIAIGKCAEMVKYTMIESKQKTFIKLLQCL
jgi:hypothetical protein